MWSVVPGVSDAASFFVISRAVVNRADGGGSAPDPLVLSAGALPKTRRLVHAVRDRAFLPVPSGTREGEWILLGSAPVIADDVGAWPYSVEILVKWVTFLGTLHRPAVGADLGLVVSRLLKFSSYMSSGQVRGWSWTRMSAVIGGLDAQFQCRLFRFVQALIFGALVGSWERFFRALRTLPGGIGRFIPCFVGANHCRLGILVGSTVGMVSRVGLVKLLRGIS